MSICKTITGEAVSAPYRALIQSFTSQSSLQPKLVGILANTSAPSRAYAAWTEKACRAVGIEYELRVVKFEGEEGTAGQGEVEEEILKANVEEGVHGIMVYYPIFGPRQDSYLQNAVAPTKDVEGLNFTWLFSLYHNVRFVDPIQISLSSQIVTESTPKPGSTISDNEGTLVKAILPCTPLAIVKTLEHCLVYNTLLSYGSRCFGRTITVVNRSEVVGRPLAALLANDGARVFSVDLDGVQEFTRRKVAVTSEGEPVAGVSSFLPKHIVQSTKMTLEECLAISDVVISGVPSASYQIKTSQLKEGVVAINFSESKNFEPTIKEKASLYCPGIGKCTITMLQRNLIRLMEYKKAGKGEQITVL